MELKHAGSIVPDSSILYRQHYDHCITFIPSVLHSSHSICHISEVNTQKKTQHSAVFFALSVLQFCKNDTCSAPLHIPLTEAVLCRGGTLELVKILNRFGAVASRHCCCHWFLKAHPVQKTRRHVLIHLWMELRVLWLLPYQSKSYHSIIFYSCCLLSTKIWVH